MKIRNLPGAVMVHLQHTPLIKQQSIDPLSWDTLAEEILQTVMFNNNEVFLWGNEEFLQKKMGTYISQVEQ